MRVPSNELIRRLASRDTEVTLAQLARVSGRDHFALSKMRSFLRDEAAILRVGRRLGLESRQIFADEPRDPVENLASLADEWRRFYRSCGMEGSER